MIAFPLYDVEDAPGLGVADADAGDDGSLSDHEAAFGERPTAAPDAEAPEPEPDDEPEPAARERNPDGTFTKPRHRAKSQQATAEDVPRIAALTKRLREAEERAEAAERRAAERRAEAREPETERRDAERREPAKVARPKFPTFEEWQALPENKDGDWYAYSDAREDFRYEARRAAERAEEAAATAQREWREQASAYAEKLSSFVKTRPDFDEIVSGERAQTSKVVEHAVIAVGPEAAYYLATHDEDRLALTDDTLYVHPDDPAFKATVAATRRYLSTLVASQRSSSSRAVAGSTGAARASLAPPAPKPPTLVRTGATRDTADAPDDEGSLADHEKAFGPKRRRA